jgi:hypothetical protein
MTIEDIRKTLSAANTHQTDKLDFVVGNFKAIEQRHQNEIRLSANDMLILTQALRNTQTIEDITKNLYDLLNFSDKQ